MMNWTKKTPSEDGYYWLRRADKDTTLVHVRDINEGLVMFGSMVAWIGSDWDTSLIEVLEKCKCEWFGPLDPPP